MTSDKIELEIKTISKGVEIKNFYLVFFSEVQGKRIMPILISNTEYTWIAHALQDKTSPQSFPLCTVLTGLMDLLDIIPSEIYISHYATGQYYVHCLLEGTDFLHELPISMTQGIILSILYKLPIYVDRETFEQQYTSGQTEGAVSFPLSKLSNTVLEDVLRQAIGNENYELASLIRDELKRRT